MHAARPAARERLLHAADRLLFDRGIRATPVDEVLREAGVAAATLYAHFGTKDGLVAAALEARLRDWREIWDRHVLAAADDTGRMLAIFDALEDYRSGVRGASARAGGSPAPAVAALPAAQPSVHEPARWCAFLAASAELRDAPAPVAAVLADDTALLDERLLRLAQPLAPSRARELADAVQLAYSGTLAAFLRGTPEEPIAVGRRLARAAISAHGVGDA
ncbi:helix-turn-helix domain-containing protein [Agrococcus sp. 1P02AA]|uniref:TetR/AcrR family transcriptional regulator n=1 Tax=Agrococcus sp. 1P02AA TaxID=3132259 RepID=UPI0039A64D88